MKNSRASSNARIKIVTPLKICVLWRNAIFIQRVDDLYSKQRAKQKKEGGLWMLLILCGFLFNFFFCVKYLFIPHSVSLPKNQTVSNCTYISLGFRNLSLHLTFIRWMRGKEKRPFIKTNANIFLMKQNSVQFFLSPLLSLSPFFSLFNIKRHRIKRERAVMATKKMQGVPFHHCALCSQQNDIGALKCGEKICLHVSFVLPKSL